MKDTDLANVEAVEGRTTDRSDTQLEQAKAQFNSARADAMKQLGYHHAFWNHKQRGIA